MSAPRCARSVCPSPQLKMLSTAVMCLGLRSALVFGCEDENQDCEPYLKDEGEARQEGDCEPRQSRPPGLNGEMGRAPRRRRSQGYGGDPGRRGPVPGRARAGPGAGDVPKETLRSPSPPGQPRAAEAVPAHCSCPSDSLQSGCPSSDRNRAVQPDGAGGRRHAFNSASH